MSDEPEVDAPEPEPELEPLPVPTPLESFEEPRLPLDEPLPIPEEPDDEPEEEELATSIPRALAVFSSMRPVACRLFDF